MSGSSDVELERKIESEMEVWRSSETHKGFLRVEGAKIRENDREFEEARARIKAAQAASEGRLVMNLLRADYKRLEAHRSGGKARTDFKRELLDICEKPLQFIPEDFDFFYEITEPPEMSSHHCQFRFELHARADGTTGRMRRGRGGVSGSLATCTGKILKGDLLYIDWLWVTENYRGLQLAYLMLYISGLFAQSKGCYRVKLQDATLAAMKAGAALGDEVAAQRLQSEKHAPAARERLYRRVGLEYVGRAGADELKSLHSRASVRLATKCRPGDDARHCNFLMIGSLEVMIQRLEGGPGGYADISAARDGEMSEAAATAAIEMMELIHFNSEDVKGKLDAKRNELIEQASNQPPGKRRKGASDHDSPPPEPEADELAVPLPPVFGKSAALRSKKNKRRRKQKNKRSRKKKNKRRRSKKKKLSRKRGPNK